MRIVVWGINYSPEQIGIAPCTTGLCEFLSRIAKCEVTMLTSFPYYPFGSNSEGRGDSGAAISKRVKIVRCWMYVPKKIGMLTRMLHEASFTLSSALRMLFLRKPDLAIIISPPFLLGVAARVLGWLRGFPYVLHIQDLQPDAAVRLQMIRGKGLIKVIQSLAAFGEGGAWRISGISRGMLDVLALRGVNPARLIYFPNGILARVAEVNKTFRKAHGFSDGDFIVAYSGNLGVKQGLRRFVDAAQYCQDTSVRLVVCGEGPDKDYLTEVASGCTNILMLPLQEETMYWQMLAESDLLVVSLLPGTGAAFFPSKLLSACVAGRPVLALCDESSELARVVHEARCGTVVSSEVPQLIAASIDNLAGRPEALAIMGVAGQKFSHKFQWESLLEEYTQSLGVNSS